jgi:hypothetical protein
MLVEVVPLRREGEKRRAEDVLTARPERGYLFVQPETIGQGGGSAPGIPTISATLMVNDNGGGPVALPGLSEVRIRRWRGRQLILIGQEYVPGSGVPGRYWPQAWWVRIVGDSIPQP